MAIVSQTYKTVENILKQFSINHAQIFDYHHGLINDISAVEHKFVLMAVEPRSTTFPNKMSARINFYVAILDIIDSAEEIRVDALSNTLNISRDLVGYLRDVLDRLNLKLVGEPNAQALLNVFDDKCDGWLLDIVIEIPMIVDACEISSIIS